MSLLFAVLGFIFIYPEAVGLCGLDRACFSNYPTFSIGEPLAYSMTVLSIVLMILLFVSEQAFNAWKKFAIWAIPIGVILLWLAPTSTPGGLGISFFNYTKESASWGVSLLFFIISMSILVRAKIQGR